ncbi:MAG: hypothetical protein AB1523_09580 [Bacillota bacterium]
MEQLQPTSASEFKKGYRKLHKLPSGRVVEIRKLTPDDFAELYGQMTSLTELQNKNTEEIARLVAESPEIYAFGLKAAEIIVTKGVVKPRISNRPLDETDENEVHISDVGEDMEDLVKAILIFSGVSFD